MNYRPSFFSSFGSISFAALALLVVGCGGTTSEPGATAPVDGGAAPTPSASASGSGTPNAPDAAAPTLDPCPDIVDDGPAAALRMVAESAPTAVGGTIASGKYHLVDVSVFTGPSGPSGALEATVTSTVRITGNTADAVIHGPEGESRMRLTLAPNANEVTYASTCGSSKTRSGRYSAGVALTLFLDNDVGQVVTYTYERAKK